MRGVRITSPPSLHRAGIADRSELLPSSGPFGVHLGGRAHLERPAARGAHLTLEIYRPHRGAVLLVPALRRRRGTMLQEMLHVVLLLLEPLPILVTPREGFVAVLEHPRHFLVVHDAAVFLELYG